MLRKLIPSILAFCLIFSTAFAQIVTFQGKYHMVDSSELYVPLGISKAFTPTAPPSGSIRAIAEWEPAQAVLVTYPGNFGIPYALIAEMSQDINVITMVESSGQQSTVTSNYNSNGVNLSNCSFIIAPLNSYWARDYSPWFIMVNNSNVAIIDFPYNRPSRVDDDNVPIVMANYMGINWYGMNVYHTGGNYMCDGMGVAAMTDLVEDENTLSHAQIDTAFKQYMGITKNYITTDPLDDYIKHIDCWGKFIDVDKIIVASVSVSDYRYTDYEAMATYWANQVSSYGNNYQVYRVYEPNGQPYSNCLILNNKVLMPFVTGTGSTQNAVAQAVYQQAMPGYEVIGFSQLFSAPWESTDALHCRAHEIADKNMLYVQHMPYWGPQPNLSQYPVSANIYNLSGSNIISDSVWIKYQVNNGSWIQAQMTHSTGNLWTANIPQQVPGDTVRYFIHAADLSPHSVNHPLIGMPDPHKFYITSSVNVEEKEAFDMLVFPNPAVNDLFIERKNGSDEPIQVRILNTLGALVQEVVFDGNQMLKLDVSQYPAGSYFVHIKSGENFLVKNVVVMR